MFAANSSLLEELKQKVPKQRREIESLENEIDQYTQMESMLLPKVEAAQRQLVEGKSSLSAHKSRGEFITQHNTRT